MSDSEEDILPSKGRTREEVSKSRTEISTKESSDEDILPRKGRLSVAIVNSPTEYGSVSQSEESADDMQVLIKRKKNKIKHKAIVKAPSEEDSEAASDKENAKQIRAPRRRNRGLRTVAKQPGSPMSGDDAVDSSITTKLLHDSATFECDGESEEGEVSVEALKREAGILRDRNSQFAKKALAKKAIKSMHSESQRLVRESSVAIPTYHTKRKTLDGFLKRLNTDKKEPLLAQVTPAPTSLVVLEDSQPSQLTGVEDIVIERSPLHPLETFQLKFKTHLMSANTRVERKTEKESSSVSLTKLKRQLWKDLAKRRAEEVLRVEETKYFEETEGIDLDEEMEEELTDPSSCSDQEEAESVQTNERSEVIGAQKKELLTDVHGDSSDLIGRESHDDMEQDGNVNNQDGDERDSNQDGDERDSNQDGDERDSNQDGDERDSNQDGDERDSNQDGDERDSNQDGDERDSNQDGDERDSNQDGDERDSNQDGDERDSNQDGDEHVFQVKIQRTRFVLSDSDSDESGNHGNSDTKYPSKYDSGRGTLSISNSNTTMSPIRPNTFVESSQDLFSDTVQSVSEVKRSRTLFADAGHEDTRLLDTQGFLCIREPKQTVNAVSELCDDAVSSMSEVLGLCSGTFGLSQREDQPVQSDAVSTQVVRELLGIDSTLKDTGADRKEATPPGDPTVPLGLLTQESGTGEVNILSLCSGRFVTQADLAEKREREDSSDDEMPVLRKKVKKVKKKKSKLERLIEFMESEAELSGSDVGSDLDRDESGSELDIYEEEGGDVQISDSELKKQVNKIHMKKMLNEDKADIKHLKEKFLGEGDLCEDGMYLKNGFFRKRKFHASEMSVDLFSEDRTLDSGGEELEEVEEDLAEVSRRKERVEKDQFLRYLKNRSTSVLNEDEDSQSLLNDIIISKPLPSVSSSSVKPAPPAVNRQSSGTQHCGSFLNRPKTQLKRLASVTSSAPNLIGGKKGFVFQVDSNSKQNSESQTEKQEPMKKKCKFERGSSVLNILTEDSNSVFEVL